MHVREKIEAQSKMPRKLTYKDRVAATECVRLIALLAEATNPHAKGLATVVAKRLRSIVAGECGAIMTAAALAEWIELAEKLKEGSER